MDGMMRLARRWAVMAGTAVAGLALAVGASAAPKDRGAAAPMAFVPGAGFEAGSVLLTAPRTGAPILIWSLDDGYSRKLVWSKFNGERWSRPKPMTFGSGDDLSPVAGVSSTGSILYWIDDRGRLFYAPFDPESGSLHAVPAPITLAGRTGRVGTEGGVDSPVILVYCDSNGGTQPCIPGADPGGAGGSGGHTGLPPKIGPDGATDAPIVLSTGGTSTNSVAVASSPACGSQIMATASEDSVSVMMFDGAGRSTLLGQYRLGPNVERNAAVATLSAYFLKPTCR